MREQYEQNAEQPSPFTVNSIVNYIRNSGKNIQLCPIYMVMKPFERGVDFFIEGYLHNVLVKHYRESKNFYFRARCYRSLQKNESPHKIKLAISTEQPFDVLASLCTCVAACVGFCNHVVGLMYLVSVTCAGDNNFQSRSSTANGLITRH